jgi:triacylglycerol lipase
MDEHRSPFEAIAGWSPDLSAALLEDTTRLFEALVPRPVEERVERDRSYGPHSRHRLDIYKPAQGGKAPILLFVHGGGFVRGDKGRADQPFYNNIGAWCARNGIVGATMTYRLAPEYVWPSGAQDVARAAEWLAHHASEIGGDPKRIFVMGHSAGAAHVADTIAGCGGEAPVDHLIAGAIMVSGIYRPDRLIDPSLGAAYYGAVTDGKGESRLARLLNANVRLLFGVAERDGRDFLNQAQLLTEHRLIWEGAALNIKTFPAHNHFSTVLAIGTEFDRLGPEVTAFLSQNRQ